jgi:predicted ATPase/class 3 adenylate cyclase/DNA-binding CsgD family transcriptional regulator
VTFLFTDVEGSTALWEQHPRAMRAALAHHDSLLRSTIVAHEGYVFSAGGDGFAAVFDRAEPAVRAAIASQAALSIANWPDDLALSVRMGLHTGEAQEREGDYFGPSVNRAARVMDAANGRQILVSAATYEIVGGVRAAAWRWVDLGVHELRDVLDPVRLYRVEAPAFASDPRPPRTGSVRAGNLPAAPAPLVGRSDDIEALAADLAAARVVTLTGVGGIGKTRLALEVGRRLQAERPDGVWLAALDTIDRPDAVLPTLLGLFSIDARAADELSSLVDGLRYRDALLILDNCEHVLDVVVDVATSVTSSCPDMQLLATSREPLDVDGERVRRVRSLSLDEDGAAVDLFRLRAVEAGATIDPVRDTVAVIQICRRLDGIPLAIELAAARTRSLRPAEIATRLDDMFRLLTGGKRASAARHRTLRATLEWSHDMLSKVEQAVLARLSVFAGSFGLDAAESIACADEVADVVDVLDRLVARSLLVPQDGTDESRFRLLEPVRHLAAEKLAARGEADITRARHTEWFCELMNRLGSLWRTGSDQAAWPIAARELSNLRAAFDHLVETGRVDDAERFVVAAYGPIACHFDVAPMYEWAPKARAIEPDHIGPFTASVCAIAAWGAIARDELDEAARWLRRGVGAIEAGMHDDGLVAAAAIHHVMAGGELAVSDDFLERSVTGALESNDVHRQIWVLFYAGRFDEATERAERLGNRLLVAMTRSWGARRSAEGGDEARERFWEAAQESHSYLMRNHATLELGLEQIRAGAPLDGLLLLRAPARDWLLRGDARVWSVLHAIAMGFARLGEVEFAARLAGAIGDRPLPFVRRSRRAELAPLLESLIDAGSRRRYEAAGAGLDAGTAVQEALARIDALTAALSDESHGPVADVADLTARQREVAQLVARGYTNKQIAQRLGISRYTAETHVRNILERLGAASRSEIATWYVAQRATASGMPPPT